ncbi:hypothetical protein H6P81_006430 [Aristolochia fimbriata]|uniref:Uncharacterized protein n=1 Tax=Aristolochia fimbriata TaxID=158543 RepID=A0AAV7F103_ARIFI|nr:hypothetical protein H6P81_006430 [Aristolochia fimbriata]
MELFIRGRNLRSNRRDKEVKVVVVVVSSSSSFSLGSGGGVSWLAVWPAGGRDSVNIVKGSSTPPSLTLFSSVEGVVVGRTLRRFLAAMESESEQYLSVSDAAEATRLRRVEFQWFLMALSVRPGRSLAMAAHLFPWAAWAEMITSSSSSEKGRCCTEGLNWLHHRSRHDFPDLPGTPALIADQFLGPCCVTSFLNTSSSSGLHDPFIRSPNPTTIIDIVGVGDDD